MSSVHSTSYHTDGWLPVHEERQLACNAPCDALYCAACTCKDLYKAEDQHHVEQLHGEAELPRLGIAAAEDAEL